MSLVNEADADNRYQFLEFNRSDDPEAIGEVFKEFGVCVVRDIVPKHFVNFLSLATQCTIETWELRSRFFHYDGTGDENPDYNPFYWVRMEEIEKFCAPLGFDAMKICAAALQSSGIAPILFRYFDTTQIQIVRQLFIARRQVPGAVSNELPFHQDVTNYTNADFVNVWVPLTSCGTRSATLELIPVATREQFAVTDRTDSYHPTVEVDAEAIYARFGADASYRPLLEPGDVLLFNEHTIHRTHMPANADMERRSVEIRVCDHFNPTPY